MKVCLIHILYSSLLYSKTKKANNKKWKELNLIKIRKLMPQRRVL